MITRYAFFEGAVRKGLTEAFRDAVLEELLPTWRAFPGAADVRVRFAVERDDDAPEYPMILAVDYPDRAALDHALASPERQASRAATERVLPRFFDGRIHHHVTDSHHFRGCPGTDGGEAKAAAITRYALLEGSVPEDRTAAFRQSVLDDVVPAWRALPGALAVRIAFAEGRDEAAPEFPLIVAIDYADIDMLGAALASPERDACREALEGRVLPAFFSGRLHHHVTAAHEVAATEAAGPIEGASKAQRMRVRAGARAVKMTDVAKAAGVSPMTVSRAFRADASIEEKTRKRVLEAAEKLGYMFDERASNLRSRKSDFVAVTVPTINNPNFAETVDALSLQLASVGLQVLLGYDRYDTAEEELRLQQLLRRRPEAIVVTGGRHSARSRRLLEASGIPVIETWDLPEQPLGHVVGFSNSSAMQLAVDHVVARGARRIAFIGGDFNQDTRGADRRSGFIQSMERHGLDPGCLIPIGGPSSIRNGTSAMAHLLDTHSDIEAVVGVFDHASFGALAECQRRGIRVPEDIMIASFGAIDIATFAYPSITTVDPHASEIGRRVGLLIADLLENPERKTGPIRIEIGPVLRIGESTG